jgi:hypothetical protein
MPAPRTSPHPDTPDAPHRPRRADDGPGQPRGSVSGGDTRCRRAAEGWFAIERRRARSSTWRVRRCRSSELTGASVRSDRRVFHGLPVVMGCRPSCRSSPEHGVRGAGWGSPSGCRRARSLGSAEGPEPPGRSAPAHGDGRPPPAAIARRRCAVRVRRHPDAAPRVAPGPRARRARDGPTAHAASMTRSSRSSAARVASSRSSVVRRLPTASRSTYRPPSSVWER